MLSHIFEKFYRKTKCISRLSFNVGVAGFAPSVHIFIFPLKCDTKITIDIFLQSRRGMKKELASHIFHSNVLRNWVWHRKITPLKPFFPFCLLPAIQNALKVGFRKLFEYGRKRERLNYKAGFFL